MNNKNITSVLSKLSLSKSENEIPGEHEEVKEVLLPDSLLQHILRATPNVEMAFKSQREQEKYEAADLRWRIRMKRKEECWKK